MKTIKDYFDIRELVCKDVYKRFGQKAWEFLDYRLLSNLFIIRDKLGLPIYVNNWHTGGNLSERGLRCNLCKTTKAYTDNGNPYVSAHLQGKAIDFNVKGQTPDETRKWLMNNAHILPFAIRIEDATPTWVHLDVRNDSGNKVIVFKV